MLGARPPAGPTPPHAHGRQNGGAKAKVLHGPAAAAAAAAASAPQGEALRQEQRDAVKRKKRQNCATLDEIALKVLPAEGICRRGLLLRLTEFILPPPHPSVKEMYPRGAFPTIKLIGKPLVCRVIFSIASRLKIKGGVESNMTLSWENKTKICGGP